MAVSAQTEGCPRCKALVDTEAVFCPSCGVAIDGNQPYDDYEYEAFLSYRHLPRDSSVTIRVQREVELFASYHGRDKILVALAEGEPDDSFPELLLSKNVVDPDGTVRSEPAEPPAADFRPRSRRKFKAEALRLVAGILGCGYDDLVQRQKTRRNALIARGGGPSLPFL